MGKVLCGLQVSPNDAQELDDWLLGLGYPFVEETDNWVYRDFLGAQ